jgi:phospholipid N-methyltransferase
MASDMKQTYIFVKNFFKKPISVGSLVPSSRFLAESITQNLDVQSQDSIVVELGPGTGAITEQIIKKIDAISQYRGIEISDEFRKHLVERFQGIHVIAGSAQDIKELLHELEGRIDFIISSLPFTNMPYEKALRILNGCHSLLREGGEFRMFLYLHTVYLPKNRRLMNVMERIFRVKSRKVVYINFPPAVIYTFMK